LQAERFKQRDFRAATRGPLFVEVRPPHEHATRALRIGAALLLALHGLIHLLGAFTYLGVAEFEGLPYRTALLDGRLDSGEAGARLFGVGWLVAAVAFGAVGLGLLLRRAWWRRLVLLVAPFSLALCLLAWPDAAAGAVLDAAIILAVLLPPQRTGSGLRRTEAER
jgi:hypothetical protein